jgi:hypothetical protein
LHSSFVEVGDVPVLEPDLAAEHFERSRQQLEHRQHRERLARPTLADDAELLSRKDLKADTAHDLADLTAATRTDAHFVK